MVKVSEFLYGMIIAIGIFAIMSVFISSTMVNYGQTIPAQHNQTFNIMKNITGINTYISEQKEKALSENEEDTPKSLISDVIDILGLWFERGIATLKLIPKVLTLFESMSNALLSSASGLLGVAYEPLKFMVISLATVAIIIGVIVSVLVNNEV